MSPPRKFSQKKQAAAPHLDDRLMAIGYLTKAHGIRGEVVMVLQAESAEALQGEIYLRPRRGGVAKPVTLTGIRRHHGNLLLSLDGVNTRDEAELLRSNTVLVTESSLPPLEEDEIYLKDLPGLKVFALEDGKERELGVIHEVNAPAGQDIWTIITPGGKEILFPAVENFVLSIQPGKGKATIAPPPGLLEIYLDPGAE